MARKLLENIKMGYSWTSYIGAAEGILRGAGWWDGELYQLMGMTGIGFHFIIHQQACPSSVTVYDWQSEHLLAMDRIGIHSEFYSVFNDGKLNTFPQIRETAVARIKESLDRGVGVLIWAPTPVLEFGIINGYDDADEVFPVDGCANAGLDPLLYKNLGRSEIPMLSYQIFLGKVPVNPEKIYRASLEFGVSEWNKEYHTSPLYASGRRGYQNLSATLERGDFNQFGLAYNLAVYADAKQAIAKYLAYLATAAHALPGLDKAAGLYREVSDRFQRLAKLVPFSGVNGVGGRVDPAHLSEVSRLVKEAWQLEEEAMAVIAKVLEK